MRPKYTFEWPKATPVKRSIPVIPRLPADFPPSEPNPVVAICGECGLEIREVMAYSCPSIRCPVQVKAVL